jgi:hypothetical protein
VVDGPGVAPNPARKAVFTVALGAPSYIDMACALARSFKYWHSDGAFDLFLATDAARIALPVDLKNVSVIPLAPDQFGSGFSPKLHLDKIAPATHSLFIDADSLCVGSLHNAFEAFKNHSVSAIGRHIRDGEWFGDVATLCRRLGVQEIPRFNGGVYYVEPGDMCTKVFETARELEQRYDELGFVRLRGRPNDEVLISTAMAIHKQEPIPETGEIMNSLLAGPGGIEVDVLSGHALLKNPRNHPKHNDWYELEEMRPRIIHFLGTDVESFPYGREIERLRLVCAEGWPVWLAKVWTTIRYTVPRVILESLKNVFRPAYHAVFGPRKMRGSRS